MAEEKKLTANEYTNVKDIKESFLFTKDGYLMSFVKVGKLNIDLLKEEEKEGKCNQLSSSFEGEKTDFVYTSYPREVDIDNHKNEIKECYQMTNDIGRKNILEIILEKYNQLSTSGENFSHQHYYKLWSYIGNRELREVKAGLIQRAGSYVKRYDEIGVKAEILEAGEIIKLCNLYGNAVQAPFDVPVNTMHEGMILLK